MLASFSPAGITAIPSVAHTERPPVFEDAIPASGFIAAIGAHVNVPPMPDETEDDWDAPWRSPFDVIQTIELSDDRGRKIGEPLYTMTLDQWLMLHYYQPEAFEEPPVPFLNRAARRKAARR